MSTIASSEQIQFSRKPAVKVPSVTIRFAGDSGDGMQLAGTQFSDTSAALGNDISTLPDYPAEIRAPAGTVAGVSGYQIHFASDDIYTPGDDVDTLVAMNPAALKTGIKGVKKGGIVILNEDAFAPGDLKRAGYESSPLEDGSLSSYRIIKLPIDRANAEAVKEVGLTAKQADRCKNFFALGVVYWLYARPLEPTLQYIQDKFGRKNPAAAKANELALKAGFNLAETCELFTEQYRVEPAKLERGIYRKVTGNEAFVLGLAAAAQLGDSELFYGTYPITPASEILHGLAELKNYRVTTFQAEDEICAIGATIGAAFGGAFAVTGTSGPGLALKTEAIGLAVMTELPIVIIDVQRGGPSTGLPTKTEQSDLFQAVYGRNGECPVPVIAASSPTDCFNAAVEAFRIAVQYMTPVMVLSDGYIANSAEPWRIPDVASLPKIPVVHPQAPNDEKGYMPYKRNGELVRPWAIPGTPGLEHRIGGLEKQDVTGAVSYDTFNHDRMVRLRAAKVAGIKPAGDAYLWTGPESGDVLLVGWGGTYGAIKAATRELREQGLSVSSCHIRYINPLPADLGSRLKQFKRIIVAELNLGQLCTLLRSHYLVDARSLNKVRGQPFTINELIDGVKEMLKHA